MFFYPDSPEILETWNWKYFRTVRIEKWISLLFLGEVEAWQCCFEIYWPLTSLFRANLGLLSQEGLALRLGFLELVFAFTFKYLKNIQDKHCSEHYDYDRKNMIQYPSFNVTLPK